MVKFIVVGVIVVVFTIVAVQSATLEQLESIVNEYGTTEKYCTYKDIRYKIGSRFTDMDSCVKCYCTKHGLGCSLTAPGLHVQDMDSQCMNVVDNCRNKWVMKDDVTKKCPKRLRPKAIEMVGK